MSFKVFALASVLTLASLSGARADVAAPLCDVAIPSQFSDDGIFVTASVNGHRDRMFLDTGATGMFLGASEAGAFGVNATGEKTFNGVGGDDTEPTGVVGDLAIGPFHLSDVPVALQHEAIFDEDILGTALFSKYVVTIDFAKKSITICDPRAFRPSPAASAQIVTNGLLSAAFDDQYGNFLIDTGSIRTVLFGEFAKSLKLKRYVGVSYLDGIGTESFQVYRFDAIAIGPIQFRDFAVWAQTRPEKASKYYDGMIGRDLLQAMRITFDYPGGAVFIERG